jgi:hypothetical protein
MMALSFKIAVGSRKRIYSWVRVPWDLRKYFTVSHSRLSLCRQLLLAGLRWRYSTPPPHGSESLKSKLYVPTDGKSATLSCCQAPIWGLQPDFYYSKTVAGVLVCGSLSDERTGLPFIIAAAPRQCSHS